MRMKVAQVEGRCGGWKGKMEGKERAMDDAPFLYPAKAAAGPCARLARCGRSRFPHAGLPSGPLLIYRSIE
jgi:hypothetical protein